MTKNNPLFVDSTKLPGDLVPCHVELLKVCLRDGESVSIHLVNHEGRLIQKPLQAQEMEEGCYEARLHLNHQTQVYYQFVIEDENNNILFKSQVYCERAQYALTEQWEPSEEDQKLPVIDSNSPVSTKPTSPSGWQRERPPSYRELMEKWGF